MTIRASAASLAFLFIASIGHVAAQQPSTADMERTMAELQASNISANVPPDASFMALLQRDVRAYRAANRLPSKAVEIEPLRKGPTQAAFRTESIMSGCALSTELGVT